MKLNHFLVMSHFHLSSEEQLPRYQKIRNLIINLTSHKPPDAKTSSLNRKIANKTKSKPAREPPKFLINIQTILKASESS